MSNQTLEKFRAERTTVWDFPVRGDWATHKGDYRGNFAPQIARNVRRNLRMNYSAEGELVLDPMVGSGTTLIEARLLNRNALGCDVNQKAIDITRERIDFAVENASKQVVRKGMCGICRRWGTRRWT